MSSILDTAEYRKLALIAAGVNVSDVPPILDTATWRRMMIAALLQNTANQAIAGRVDYYGQLPATTGSPAIGTTYLVLNSSGIYYVNYRSAGVYVKLTDTGSLSDWVYAPLSAIGTLPDVTLTNLQVGDTITWNGTRWVNSANIGEPELFSWTTPGTFSWSIPTNAKYLKIRAIGGGGGGFYGNPTGIGSGGSGGSGGAFTDIEVKCPSPVPAVTNISVGFAGIGGTYSSGSVPTAGGNSSITITGIGQIIANGGAAALVGAIGLSGASGMLPGNNGTGQGSNGQSLNFGAGGGGGGGSASTSGILLPAGNGGRSAGIINPATNLLLPGPGGSGGSAAFGSFPANAFSGLTPLSGTFGGGGGGGGGSAPISGPANAGDGGSGRSGLIAVWVYS